MKQDRKDGDNHVDDSPTKTVYPEMRLGILATTVLPISYRRYGDDEQKLKQEQHGITYVATSQPSSPTNQMHLELVHMQSLTSLRTASSTDLSDYQSCVGTVDSL